MKGRTQIREIQSPHDSALEGAYALLRRTFHSDERVPLSEWRQSLAERESRVWTDIAWHLFVAIREGDVIGLASGNYLGNVNIGVIGYLAIEPHIRARGLGGRLRLRLRRAFERDALRVTGRKLLGIIGEVAADNPWLRKLASHPRVLPLDFLYFQPRLHPKDKPTPFVLYYESIARPRRSIPVAELRRILYTVWRRVYRIGRPLERPDFRRMIRSLEGRRRVGALRLTPLKDSR
jgi:hypothetical protein